MRDLSESLALERIRSLLFLKTSSVKHVETAIGKDWINPM